jgi:hypothetical protein
MNFQTKIFFLLSYFTAKSSSSLLATRARAALERSSNDSPQSLGLLPPNSLTHFCVVTSWTAYEDILSKYASFLGVAAPTPGIAGGPDSNSSYLGRKLLGTTKIAFLQLNNLTRMEFLAGEPDQPSWWRDVYLDKGLEIHHQGYEIPESMDVWQVAQNFTNNAWGQIVQWGHWGNYGMEGSGCYVYVDSQLSLGVTVELLGGVTNCANLPVSN